MSTEASALQIAWSHIGRMAIEMDHGFNGGDYYDAAPGTGPHRGLAVARMAAQVTYRSDEVFTERFHRTLLGSVELTLADMFDVEGYLEYHGAKLVRRFDANSYLRLNRAMDLTTSDEVVAAPRRRSSGSSAPVLVAAVRCDGLYPPIQQARSATDCATSGGDADWVELDSPHGHDGFLIETERSGPASQGSWRSEHEPTTSADAPTAPPADTAPTVARRRRSIACRTQRERHARWLR